MTEEQAQLAHQILSRHSKSFALAGKLLPPWCRRDAAALYAWCRRCDDAVDAPVAASAGAEPAPVSVAAIVETMRRELDGIYAGRAQSDPVLAAFQDVVRRHEIPRAYPDDLLAGMAMDAGAVRYQTFDQLLLYCYRAAGTVGLMMAHVMKVRDDSALRRAADLGMAMQLTNICRDVAEDERRDRVYLPRELLASDEMPTSDTAVTATAVAELLRRADVFYRSGDLGLGRLPARCAIAIRAARLIYAEIGQVIARRNFDVRAGRAVVSKGRKLWLLIAAVVDTVAARLAARFRSPEPALPGGGELRAGPLPFQLLPTGQLLVPGRPGAAPDDGAGAIP